MPPDTSMRWALIQRSARHAPLDPNAMPRPALREPRLAKCDRAGARRDHFGGRQRKTAPLTYSRACQGASLVCDIRHDLSHLHGLAGRHLLDPEDDLVVRRAGCVLEQFPQTLQ
jgi:hypothetical protein